MQWSEVKQEVFRFESDIVVSAGAGSGKTAALVELYLRLLAGETALGRTLAVEEIVAITFTDKAATEMKERVRAGVLQRLAAAGDPRLWEERRRALPGAAIATFHSFCARLLRENPAEAGVDPAFTLLDEATAGAELAEALAELLEEELTARSGEIRLLLSHFPLTGRGHGKGVREHLIDLHWQRSGAATGEGELAAASERWNAKARATLDSLPERFAAIADRLRPAIRERELKGGKEPAFLGKMRELLALCEATPVVAESGESAVPLERMRECVKGSWGQVHAGFREEVKEYLETAELAFCQLRGAPLTAALLALEEKLAETYRRRKEVRGLLDFDDLQRKCRDLLAGDAELRAAIRQRYAVVMVDEFQDTNPLQKELVGLLAGPGQRLFLVGDPKQSIYLFRGADVAVFARAQRECAERGGRQLYFQESFRSRQGLIDFVNRLFGQVMAGGNAEFEVSYGAGDQLDPQRRDWDGLPCVELLRGEESGSSGERREEEAAAIAARIDLLVSGRDGVRVYDKKAGTGTQLGLKDQGPGTKDGNLEPRTSNLEPVYEPRRPRFGDIAILLRRFTNLKLYERELRRRGIPYYVVKGRGFYRCQEVLDLLNFLKYLEFGGDLTALAGVLRSPLCCISDETLYLLSRLDGGFGAWERCFGHSPFTIHHSQFLDRIAHEDRERLAALHRLVSRLRPLRDRLTLAELMEEVLTGTDFASTLLTTFQGGQKVANLRKLIEVSRAFAPPGGASLRRFVNYLTDLVESEPTEAEALVAAAGEDVVRLMTIHQSKGLEFPVVFIPELGGLSPAGSAAVICDDGLGVGVKLSPPGSPARPTLAFREIGALRRRKEAAELQRLFYVAVTRARDYLVLSGAGRGEWCAWLDSFLAGEDAALVKVTNSIPAPEEGVATLPAEVTSPAPVKVPEPAAVTAALGRALHYVPPPPSEMVFSPTALEDYRGCPRKYYYKAVLGLDEGLFAELLGPAGRGPRGRPAGRGMAALDKGNLAHRLLERLDFSASPASQRAACYRLAPLFSANPLSPGMTEVVGHVLAFAASPLARELGVQRLFREQPFILKLAGAADYFIRGAMDLVAVTEKEAAVYDYKFLGGEESDLEGYRFQLRTYMLALARAFPGKRIAGRLLFLRGGGEEEVTCDFARFEEELLSIMEDVRGRSGEDGFPLREGCDGSHCPFRQRCRLKTG
jgi:ATP-dependent helicase/nuclease subunit A